MTYSLYDATVGMATGALHSLDSIITEAEKHPNASTFFTARLADDMKPLTFQVHYACFQAQFIAAKVKGGAADDYVEPQDDDDDDDADTYEKMHALIQRALDALAVTERDTVNRLGEEMTTFQRRDEVMNVPVKGVTGLVNMPNVYFHVSMAYAILRKEGVPLGKRHWSRGFVREYI